MEEEFPRCAVCFSHHHAADMVSCHTHSLSPNRHLLCHPCVQQTFKERWHQTIFDDCSDKLIDFDNLPDSLNTLKNRIREVPEALRRRPCRGNATCPLFSISDGTCVDTECPNVRSGDDNDPALVSLATAITSRGNGVQCGGCGYIWEAVGGNNHLT